MASVGAGVKVALTKKVFLRTEFRDYITAFPTQIITPPLGAKYGTLLHDWSRWSASASKCKFVVLSPP